jgi:hypothetical protein
MGQKIHPEGFRVGYIHDWKSNWYNEKEFADYLNEDLEIRSHIENKLSHAGLSKITIKKGSGEVEVDISTRCAASSTSSPASPSRSTSRRSSARSSTRSWSPSRSPSSSRTASLSVAR